MLRPAKQEFRIYFFFPFYHVGGAEKIHGQVVHATGGTDCVIYFTRRSQNALFREDFERSGCRVRDISAYTDNKWLYFLNLIYRGIISYHINKQKEAPLVFNGQCNFAYKISPWINTRIKQVELIHALNTFAYIRLPYLGFYDRSITVSNKVIEQYKDLYARNYVPSFIFDSFSAIMSRVRLPEKSERVDYHNSVLTVLYSGRDTPDKRPWVAAAVAGRLASKYSIRFEFAGDVEQSIPAKWRSACHFLGDISEEKKMYDIYGRAHILLIPSLSESGPLVFMEAMAKGAAIISTPVGYIPQHIHNGEEGYVTTTTEEKKVIEEMCRYILLLYNDRELLQKIGTHNLDYAFNNFGIESFNEEYRELFDQIKSSAA